MDLSSCFHLCRLHFGTCHQEFFRAHVIVKGRNGQCCSQASLFFLSEREMGDSSSTDLGKTSPPPHPGREFPWSSVLEYLAEQLKFWRRYQHYRTSGAPPPPFCFIVRSNPYLLIIGHQVNITGTMHFWGLTIDTVSTICLVLAVGLSVDYASHVGHTFMIIPGSRTGECSCLSFSI